MSLLVEISYEQDTYMLALKLTFDVKGHCLLEMPSGTGKTTTLLSLIVTYILKNSHIQHKLIYCSRMAPGNRGIQCKKHVNQLGSQQETGRKVCRLDGSELRAGTGHVRGVGCSLVVLQRFSHRNEGERIATQEFIRLSFWKISNGSETYINQAQQVVVYSWYETLVGS